MLSDANVDCKQHAPPDWCCRRCTRELIDPMPCVSRTLVLPAQVTFFGSFHWGGERSSPVVRVRLCTISCVSFTPSLSRVKEG